MRSCLEEPPPPTSESRLRNAKNAERPLRPRRRRGRGPAGGAGGIWASWAAPFCFVMLLLIFFAQPQTLKPRHESRPRKRRGRKEGSRLKPIQGCSLWSVPLPRKAEQMGWGGGGVSSTGNQAGSRPAGLPPLPPSQLDLSAAHEPEQPSGVLAGVAAPRTRQPDRRPFDCEEPLLSAAPGGRRILGVWGPAGHEEAPKTLSEVALERLAGRQQRRVRFPAVGPQESLAGAESGISVDDEAGTPSF